LETAPRRQSSIKVYNFVLGCSHVDVEKALLYPGLVFKTPQELLANNELSRDQKIEILRRWEYDVRQLQVAEEEGMGSRSR
jgi:hypothetical protein